MLRQGYSHLTHHIEHIVAKQHGSSDDIDNLALVSCLQSLVTAPSWSRFCERLPNGTATVRERSAHFGDTTLACHRCNLHKGPNLTGFDPESGEIVPLFHPRRDRWAEHFVLRGPRIEGLTAIGRTTVDVLGMNDARRLDLRAELLARGELA